MYHINAALMSIRHFFQKLYKTANIPHFGHKQRNNSRNYGSRRRRELEMSQCSTEHNIRFSRDFFFSSETLVEHCQWTWCCTETLPSYKIYNWQWHVISFYLVFSVARGELAPRLSLVSPKFFFSPFCHRGSFGSLPLSPLACSVWGHLISSDYRQLDFTDTI